MTTVTSIKWRQLNGLGNTTARQDVKDAINQVVDEVNASPGFETTATASELNKLDDSSVAMNPGSGISTAAAAYAGGYFRNGDLIKTTIYIDIQGLNEGGTAGDVIGDDGEANSHIGQVTSETTGDIVAGWVTCLELPTGGTADIDFYSADEATLAEDSAISAATNGAQLINAATWVLHEVQALTTLPGDNQYLYLVGQGTGDTVYTAGKFLIELYGTP